MELWGAVLICIVTLSSPEVDTHYLFPTCPDMCICTYNFTDCKYHGLKALPKGIDLNVTSLDLSFNEFIDFPTELNTYENLINLNLSHNKISTLGFSAFYALGNLERLDLTYNAFQDWNDIKSDAFSTTRKLTFLDFSHNPLRSLPNGRNPLRINSLQILRLNNCSMRNLNANIFDNLPNLIELHVSENPITVLNSSFSSTTLRFLDLSRCNIKHLSPSAFVNLSALETLRIQQNINLKKFPCDSLSLLYLDISECNLEVIPNGYLPKVYYANFYGNHFRIIPRFSFVNITSLQYLDLSYNALSVIEENAFRGLSDVISIDLSKNTLSSLNRNLFYTNIALKTLDLSRNYFSRVEKFAIRSLESLDLSSCEIEILDKNSLADMPNLITLNLSRNIISVIPDNFKAKNLKTLDISLCRIKYINNKTLASLPWIRTINLSGNRLTTVTPECFRQVIALDITDNPWRCDCPSLKEMYLWMSKTGKWMNDLFCQSPEVFEGYTWLSVCQTEWQPNQTSKDSVWWYTTGLIVTIFVLLFMILIMRRMYLLKEKRLREAEDARREEERESLRRMRRIQLEAREEESRNAPDPRELQTPPSYNEALLLPRLDSSHPSLSGSLHSIASKHSLHGSNPDVSKRGRPRRKRRRRKSDSLEGQRASRVVVDSDTSDHEQPQPRTTLESDF